MPKKKPSPAPETVSTIAPDAPVAPVADLVEDDGEMVTREERDARVRIRRELAASKSRRRVPSAAKEAEIEQALDDVDPGWRERRAAAKATKDAEKAARLAKLKADREAAAEVKRAARAASGKPPKCTAVPTAPGARPETMGALRDAWEAALDRAGKTASTVLGYRNEIEKAVLHFGEFTPLVNLTPEAIAGFNESDRVTKTRTGRLAAKPGVDKTRRALRLALEWSKTSEGRVA